LFGWFIPRATFYRNGILVQGIRTDPSYKGNFVFMLSNLSDRAFEIELGARVASMVFHTVSGKSNKYIGQWQGGRVFIKKAERQTRQK
jgi:deoxycytidine triphosphate deaminase